MSDPRYIRLHQGCYYEADRDFVKGDRRVTCEHDREFTIRAKRPTHVVYTLTEHKKPREEPNGG